MEYTRLTVSGADVSKIALGTWAFSSDISWGHQDDRKSFETLDIAVASGINLIDTAPVYGRGHSEEVVGRFLNTNKCREKVLIATKCGLSWSGPKIFHDLSSKKILSEIDDSRKRLKSDYIDIYQVHWPDKAVPIKETASCIKGLHDKGVVRHVGVSNYNIDQMREFMRYCPLHATQPYYNMFRREIEKGFITFCMENNVSILAYIPLHSGILTGKFFFGNVPIPNDMVRKNHPDLKEPLFSINKDILQEIKKIADKYKKSLTMLVLCWTARRKGITSVLVGSRDSRQIRENLGGIGWDIKKSDLDKIDRLLSLRDKRISQQETQ